MADKFDVMSLTIDEIEQIEEIADMPIGMLADPNARKAKLMKAVAWMIKRRENPKFTLADAGRIPLAEIEALIGDDDDPKGDA